MESDYETVYGMLHVYDTMEGKLQKSADENMKKFDALIRDISANKKLYDAFANFRASAKKSNKWLALKDEDRIYIEQIIDDFERSGIALNDKEKQRMKQLDLELVVLLEVAGIGLEGFDDSQRRLGHGQAFFVIGSLQINDTQVGQRIFICCIYLDGFLVRIKRVI